jgi:hypothetical protein
MKNHIKELSEKRCEYYEKRENSWDEQLQEYKYTVPETADLLGKTILNLLIENVNELDIDFIVEELTKLGQSPSILYDDNGHFAITSDGFQSISIEPADCDMYFHVAKQMWKSTIREALEYYLSYKDSDEYTPSTQEELWNQILNDKKTS